MDTYIHNRIKIVYHNLIINPRNGEINDSRNYQNNNSRNYNHDGSENNQELIINNELNNNHINNQNAINDESHNDNGNLDNDNNVTFENAQDFNIEIPNYNDILSNSLKNNEDAYKLESARKNIILTILRMMKLFKKLTLYKKRKTSMQIIIMKI